jgi:hypothetical protein
VRWSGLVSKLLRRSAASNERDWLDPVFVAVSNTRSTLLSRLSSDVELN